MYHSCVFASARQHALVQLDGLASSWRLEAKVLRGLLRFLWLSPAGWSCPLLDGFLSPGPKLCSAIRSPPRSSGGIGTVGSHEASSLPPFCSKKKISFFNILFLAYLAPWWHVRDIEKDDSKKTKWLTIKAASKGGQDPRDASWRIRRYRVWATLESI